MHSPLSLFQILLSVFFRNGMYSGIFNRDVPLQAILVTSNQATSLLSFCTETIMAITYPALKVL